MKIVLAGSPEISVDAFKEVINNFDVLAIVTQPDRKQGRGMKIKETPVAELGRLNNIKVFKPNKISQIYNELKELDFDLFLTFAFGQWIPTKILELGKYKPLNIHGSLLPKYRGAAPIHWAILNGDQEIGITLMEMVKEMDAGNMYFKASEKINDKTTTGEGFQIISRLAKENIVNWLKEIEKNNYEVKKQPLEFTLAPKIDKEFSQLTTSLSIYEAERKILGLNPFPGAFIEIDKKRLKIFNISNKKVNNSIQLNFKDGILFAVDYQWESKKRIKV